MALKLRWPFMLRATHDALMADRDTLVKFWSDQWLAGQDAHRALQERHDAFVATIAEKSLPRPLPVVTPPPKRERDAADNAIDFASAFDPRRRRHLEQYVRARRAEGMAADDIAQAVLHPAEDGDGAWEMPE